MESSSCAHSFAGHEHRYDLPTIAIFSTRAGALALALCTMFTGTAIVFQLLKHAVEFLRVAVWVPWTVTRYMRQQGYSGPPFSCCKNNRKEMQELSKKAVSEPLHTISHDIEPRLFAPTVAWKKLYGNKLIYYPGEKVFTSTSDPEAIKEIFSTKSGAFGKSPATAVSLEILGKDGLIFAEHEEWSRQRRAVRPAFYAGKSKDMVVQMASWMDPCLQKLENAVDDNGGVVDIDISIAIGDLAKDILARSSFGINFEKGRRGFENQDKLRYLVIQREKLKPTNFIRRLLPTPLRKEIRQVKSQLSTCLREIVQERRQSVQVGRMESYGEDLLGLLLAESDKRNLSGVLTGETKCNDEHVVDQCRTFFHAGSEPIRSTILWGIVLLAHHKDWQERIRAECNEAFQSASLDGDKLVKLKQLDMFVDETLRLYPPAPFLIREVAKDNATLLGEPLPKFLCIQLNILALHRNKEYWGDDALDFNPGRFTDGIANACKKVIYAFSPFGAGPRTCVAQTFALTEVKLVITMLLQRFSFRLSPSYRHEPTFDLTLQPKFGVQVILERLRSTS